MKRNAIARIVIYSAVILLLTAALVTGLTGGLELLLWSGGEKYSTGTGSVSAGEVRSLKIDWAAGSVTIKPANSTRLYFEEFGGYADGEGRMLYTISDGVLKIRYGKPSVGITSGNAPGKDLIISVPREWFCQELVINGAALEVEIENMHVDKLVINGASNEIHVCGEVQEVDCNGAANTLKLSPSIRPRSIDIDGASCKLELNLPGGCGFRATVAGLGCSFNTQLDVKKEGNTYTLGDGYCKIEIDGLSCKVEITRGR